MVSALTLSACGGKKAATPVEGANCDAVYYEGEGSPDAIIVSDFPRRGPERREITTPMTEAIKLALRRRDFRAGDRRVGYQSCDDSDGVDFDEAACRANAKAYVADRDVLGVIGTFNSGCATQILPIIGKRSAGPLAMISPSNTYLGLTSAGTGVCCGHPATLYPDGIRSYVRVVPPDDRQGSAGAVAVTDRGAHRAVVLVQRSEDYSIALAGSFGRAARAQGMKVKTIGYEAQPSFAGLARQVAGYAPDAVYIGGLSNANGRRLVEDLRAALGGDVILIGGDAWIGLAAGPRPLGRRDARHPRGRSSRASATCGCRASSRRSGFRPPCCATSGYPSPARRQRRYFDAIGRSDGTRVSVAKALKAMRVKGGILGDFRFDANGDIDPALFSLYRFHAGKEVLAGTIAVPGELSR